MLFVFTTTWVKIKLILIDDDINDILQNNPEGFGALQMDSKKGVHRGIHEKGGFTWTRCTPPPPLLQA